MARKNLSQSTPRPLNEALQFRARAVAAIPICLGFIAILFFIVSYLDDHFTDHQSRDSFLEQAVHGDVMNEWFLMILIFGHHIRMWVGCNFMFFDSSFGEVAAKDDTFWKISVRVTSVLFVSILMFSVSLKYESVHLFVVNVSIQIVSIVYFDVTQWRKLLIEDTDHRKNIIIYVVDTLYIFSLILVCYFLLAERPVIPMEVIAGVIFFATIGFLIFELLFVYRKSIGRAVLTASMAFSKTPYWNEKHYLHSGRVDSVDSSK